MNRREFLQSTVAAAACALTHPAGGAEQKLPVAVVDTHLHCFAGAEDARFPYHPQGPYQPAEVSSPEMLLKLMPAAGVDFAVVVHPEPYQDDHRYLEYCLAADRKKLKGTCLFFADRPDATQKMRELVKRQPGQIVAARVHAYAPDRLPPFGKPELRTLWREAGELGLALQLHLEPRYAAGFEPLIKEFSQTPVIIDHLGRPLQGTPEEHAAVVAWSRFPNTIMKLSALPEVEQHPDPKIAPIIKELAQRFGPSRLIYGGGFGDKATADSYRAYRELVRSYLGDLSAAEQTQVLGGNAARLYRFG